MSFYELYEILIEKKMKLSKLSIMDDPNEGIGEALSIQLPRFNTSHIDICGYHEEIQKKTFISSWTKNSDSMAMWLLYSKNLDGIRVKTSKEKLQNVIASYSKKENWKNHLKSPKGTVQIDCPGKVHEVQYDDINRLLQKIKTLHADFRQNISNLFDEKISDKAHEKKWDKLNDDVRTEAFKISKKIRDYKSVSYSFEEELRASIELVKRNDLSYEEWFKNKDSDDLDYVYMVATCDFEDLDFPNTIYMPIENDFIEEICFDPRLPSYKRDVIKKIFKVKEDKYIESNAFGSFSENMNFGMSHFDPYNNILGDGFAKNHDKTDK